MSRTPWCDYKSGTLFKFEGEDEVQIRTSKGYTPLLCKAKEHSCESFNDRTDEITTKLEPRELEL